MKSVLPENIRPGFEPKISRPSSSLTIQQMHLTSIKSGFESLPIGSMEKFLFFESVAIAARRIFLFGFAPAINLFFDDFRSKQATLSKERASSGNGSTRQQQPPISRPTPQANLTCPPSQQAQISPTGHANQLTTTNNNFGVFNDVPF